jgi:hypothetical protein
LATFAEHLRLAADFEGNTAVSRFGIVNGFCAGINVTADTMIIAGRKSAQVVQSMKGDRIFRSIIAKGSCVIARVDYCPES